MDSNGMPPTDPETWVKQVAIYFHDVGWILGVAFMLGIKYVFWGWLSKFWQAFGRIVHKAITGRNLDIGEKHEEDSSPETDREVRTRHERDKDRDDFRDFMDELNKKALAEITRLESRIKTAESERDRKDQEIYDLRNLLEASENREGAYHHAMRNARTIADLLTDKMGMNRNPWKDPLDESQPGRHQIVHERGGGTI
jgi:hypothetical protein